MGAYTSQTFRLNEIQVRAFQQVENISWYVGSAFILLTMCLLSAYTTTLYQWLLLYKCELHYLDGADIISVSWKFSLEICR